jgi:hypothetical protein
MLVCYIEQASDMAALPILLHSQAMFSNSQKNLSDAWAATLFSGRGHCNFLLIEKRREYRR